jgi:hypothetical protein
MFRVNSMSVATTMQEQGPAFKPGPSVLYLSFLMQDPSISSAIVSVCGKICPVAEMSITI